MVKSALQEMGFEQQPCKADVVLMGRPLDWRLCLLSTGVGSWPVGQWHAASYTNQGSLRWRSRIYLCFRCSILACTHVCLVTPNPKLSCCGNTCGSCIQAV